MSSYLAFELDALNVVPDVAVAGGTTPGVVCYGLLRLWAWCFREEVEVVHQVHLKGFFGVDLEVPLEAFGFIVAIDDKHWRVCGAERYLKVKAAQREGGKLGRAKALAASRSSSSSSSTSSSEGTSRSTSRSTSGCNTGLTPSTKHHNLLLPSVGVRAGSEETQASEPAPPSRAAKATPDARHAPLVAALVAAGASFESRNARDVTRLLALATQAVGHEGAHEEVLARWRRALGRSGYPTVRALNELASHWGHFAAPRDTTLSDWSHPEQTPDANGDVKF